MSPTSKRIAAKAATTGSSVAFDAGNLTLSGAESSPDDTAIPSGSDAARPRTSQILQAVAEFSACHAYDGQGQQRRTGDYLQEW